MKYEEVKNYFWFEPEEGILYRKSTGLPVGTLGGRGYLVCGFKGRTFYVHRLIWCLLSGKDLVPKVQIDHINHKRTDNRAVNLRAVDNIGNSFNKSKRKANTSGATGVYWHKGAGKWMAFIKVNYKQIYLGLHADFDSAVKARKDAERQYGFHENHE